MSASTKRRRFLTIQVVCGRYDSDTAPWIESEQIAIAGNDDLGLRRKSEFEVFVVLGVPAICHRFLGFNDDGRCREQIQDPLDPPWREVARKFRASDNLADLFLNRV